METPLEKSGKYIQFECVYVPLLTIIFSSCRRAFPSNMQINIRVSAVSDLSTKRYIVCGSIEVPYQLSQERRLPGV